MLADSFSNIGIMMLQLFVRPQPAVEHIEELEIELLAKRRSDSTAGSIPPKLWMSGLLCSSAICVLTVNRIFAVSVLDSVLAIAFSFLVSVLAVRALGETYLNPVSGIGKVELAQAPLLKVS